MVLFTHIAIAIASLIVAGVLLVRPSARLIKVQIGLIAGTITSGVVLVVLGASLLHLCLSGLLFTSLSLASVIVAAKKLRLVSDQA